MGCSSLYLVVSLLCSHFIMVTYQLQSSQIQVLLQLRRHLEYPYQLEVWNNDKQNICYLSPSTKVNVTCEGDVVIGLRIMGDKPSNVSNFVGYAIPNHTLSESFSIDSFVTTLARLTNLRTLRLVALGIWGPLPNKINRLSSLEVLELSSNFLYGSVPPRIGTLVKLQTFRIADNFFNDTLPDWLDSLSSLSILSLKNNRFAGLFPGSFKKISTLNSLDLSNNKISGELPDLSSLSRLKVLDLSGNKLDSELPNLPDGVFMVLLNNNSFTGEIPRGFQQLNRVEHLDLSLNHLQGRLPVALLSLPNIDYLNLASNELTGSLPYHLACGERLGFVDLSNNRLIGGIPRCLTKTAVQFHGNCLTVDVKNQHPQSYCAGIHLKKSKARKAMLLVLVIGGIVLVGGLLAFGFLLMRRRCCSRGCQGQNLLQRQVHQGTALNVPPAESANLGTQGIPAYRVISMEEVKEATGNFDKSALMSEGYKGGLYKGRLRNGMLVAIRCLSLPNKFTTRNLRLRLDLLSKLRHPHLVCLLGHCFDYGEKTDTDVNKGYLVYEYVSNGNLRSHLIDGSQVGALKWSERLVILIDVAKAVQFLHTGVIPGVFNNRLKANNILLDEHRRAKLSDYGLSIIYDDNEVGVNRSNSNPKSWGMRVLEDDIYSFGFMMFDCIVGSSVSAKKSNFLLHELASLGSEEGQRRIVDPTVLSTSMKESLSTVISLANKCVSSESSTRPSFEDLLWNLQNAARLQSIADGDQRFNSPEFS